MNLKAGFWRRFLSASIDLLIVSIFIMIFSLSFINFKLLEFRNSYIFYVWALLIIFTIFTIKIAMPILSGGFTFGSLLFKTKIVFHNKKKFYSMLMRESAFSLMWIVIVTLVMVVVNHTLIIQYLRGGKEWLKLDIWGQIRIQVITSLGGLVTFVQLLFIMTLIANPNNISLYDRMSETNVIIINKFEEQPKITEILKPIKVIKQTIIWEDQHE